MPVVIFSPNFADLLGIFERQEPVLVQALLAELPVERLDERVIRDLPFQIHTGHGRLQGSSPMLLLDVIQANPKMKFVLFHGGFPWVDDTAAIAMRHSNVWIDSVWMPMLSYTMAKPAYQEWLEAVPSDRIMWGADTVQAERIYAATEFTRQCLAEALAGKVERGERREEHAEQIGRQILRENALKLFPNGAVGGRGKHPPGFLVPRPTAIHGRRCRVCGADPGVAEGRGRTVRYRCS